MQQKRVRRRYREQKKQILIMVSRTAEYYRTHPKARAKHVAYQKEYNKKPSQVKKRSELTQHNREHDKKYGKSSRAGKDASHTKNGIVYKPSSVNRGSKTDMAGDRRARGKKKK
jgi:hypothetical protein